MCVHVHGSWGMEGVPVHGVWCVYMEAQRTTLGVSSWVAF